MKVEGYWHPRDTDVEYLNDREYMVYVACRHDRARVTCVGFVTIEELAKLIEW